MPRLGRFARELRWRFWSVPVEREVEGEIAFHLEMRVRELVAGGMDPRAARAEALRRFGDIDGITEACRDQGRRRDQEMQRAEWFAELWQDVRYAARYLRSRPGFAAVAILTLALGIGASTTLFGVANAVLLRPYPYQDPQRIIRLYETNPNTQTFSLSEPNYLDWRERARGLEEMAAYGGRATSLLGDGDPEQLRALAVTPSFWPLLGVRPQLGRTFNEGEDTPGSPARVAVLSHPFWQSRFGGDPGIVGRKLNLNGTSHEVIGVMPASFTFPNSPELFLPLPLSATSPRDDHRLAAIARLANGASLEQALAELRTIAADLARQYPESNGEWGANAISIDEWIVGDDLRQRVRVLLVAVGLLLLMACVNVANLLLARATAREREMSVRAALGAGRGRIVRQLLTESLVLSVAGAAIGVLFAALAVPVLRDVGQAAIPRLDELSLDWRVLGFGIVASIVTGLLFGMVPAVQASRSALHDVLRSGARVAAAGRLRSALVVASVALALVLLVGAGLVGRSFERLMRVDYGFRSEGVLVGSVALPGQRYREGEKRTVFYAEAERRLASAPGVRAVGFTNIAPFSGGNTGIPYTVVGRPSSGPDEFLSTDWRAVSPGFFAALGVPLLKGRLIAESDGENSPNVIVISQTMAKRIWGNADPIGAQIVPQGNERAMTVIGVVGDIRDQQLEEEPRSVIYIPSRQVGWSSMWVLVRGAGNSDPMALAATLRREIRAMDPLLPVANVQPLSRLVSEIAAQPRFTALIFGLFASAALVLAVVGVYGVIAYGVAQRTRELGVRMALGATPARIVGGVLRQGVVLATVGIVVGLWGAYALSRFMATILYEVQATDVPTFAGVALLLVACAVAASVLPARVAARLDPVRALHDE